MFITLKQKLILFVIFILVLSISSCSHYYYMPNIQHVPLFIEKNEFRFSASKGIGVGEKKNLVNTEANVAYSMTKNLAFMTNFSYAYFGDKSYSANYSSDYYLELASGYYKPFYSHVVFEIYGGFGNGNQHHKYELGAADFKFTKIFIQPSVGFTFNALDIAFSKRISNLNFYKVEQSGGDRYGYESYNIDMIRKNKNSFLNETALTTRLGWKKIKLQIQIQLSNNLSEPVLRFVDAVISFGVWFTITDRYSRDAYKKKDMR
ncbi:MAG: hypothetical protein A3G23_07895 [Bacteroidetes bacterium RIFCSPLOWO2_12_FULL_37_12]|nr:MAG: hypothetical protein A3G23_07895 [Bacteroidetes bacterium RIFCSPLOWO2_12_FULL_37_12]